MTWFQIWNCTFGTIPTSQQWGIVLPCKYRLWWKRQLPQIFQEQLRLLRLEEDLKEKHISHSYKLHYQVSICSKLLYVTHYLLESQVSPDKHNLQRSAPQLDISSSQSAGWVVMSPDLQEFLLDQRWTAWGRYPDQSCRHSGSVHCTSD